jgi:hypothetical protein
MTMQRVIFPLSILLLVQVALAVLLAVRHDPLAGAKVDTPLVQADTVKSADDLVIAGMQTRPAAQGAEQAAAPAATSTRIELAKKNGSWVLPSQFDAPADSARVTTLLERLSGLKRGLPIATSDAALKRFKLVDGDFERRLELKSGGKTLDTVYVGDSPGLRKSDARTGADRAVYAVDLATYELPTDAASWLNTDVLHDDVVKLTELDVESAKGDKVELRKQAATDQQASSTWTDPALTGDKHIDSAHAEALADQLSQLRVDGVLGTELKPEWQQDHPVLTLQMKDDKSHSVGWTVSKPTSGDYYVLKSSAHPWYFSVSSSAAKAMMDAGGRDQLIVSAKPETKPVAKS